MTASQDRTARVWQVPPWASELLALVEIRTGLRPGLAAAPQVLCLGRWYARALALLGAQAPLSPANES